jgi:hypothetical protein
VDTVSCSDTFVGTKAVKKSADSYLFLVHLQPLEPSIQCQPLFVIPGKNGTASLAIQTLIDQALTVVKDNRIPVIALSSDGDQGYNRRHQKFYDWWCLLYDEFGLEKVIESMLERWASEGATIPGTDPLHFAKTFRSRLLRYLLALTGQKVSSASLEKLKRILQLDAPLNDVSPLVKMRDFFALAIFRLEHITALLAEDALVEAILLLPMTFLLNALRLDNISRATRDHMLQFSFFFLLIIMRGHSDVGEMGSAGSPVVMMQEKSAIRRLNTILRLIESLRQFPEIV